MPPLPAGWMPPPEPGCNHPQAASHNPLFPNKWKEFNNRQLSRCHCGAEAWIIIILKDIFSPPLDSFGCYCCNLKLVSSVKRSRLLCNWSWAGYWWLVSGRWQPIKTIDWSSSRVQPMGDNKSITNNDFPNQVICHQSPGGFTGSLLAANTNQAAPSWDTVQLSSLTRAYSCSKQSSQDSSTILAVKSPKILDAKSSICITYHNKVNVWSLTKRSKSRGSPCVMWMCAV